MKKFFLSLMIAGLSVITFVSADFTTYFEGNGEGGYEPGLLTINGDYSFSISDLSNYSCVDSDCLLDFINENGDVVCEIGYDQDIVLNNGNSCVFSAGEYAIDCPSGDTFGTLTIKFNSISGGNEGGSSSTGSSSVILPGGYSSLTPAIDGLKGTVSQLIPFVVYIGIGVLVAVLGFYAIRRLVNWMGIKVNSVFISKRK